MEPGRLLGVCVVRPKVYRSKQIGSVVDLMETSLTWLPALMREDYSASEIARALTLLASLRRLTEWTEQSFAGPAYIIISAAPLETARVR